MQYFCIEYGMLSFKSQANFMYVVEQIEQATEGNNDLYFYSDFDTITGFYSLRKYIQWCENKLQLADNLTIENDPDNFFVRGDAFRSLLNVHLEVKVGDSIFKIINDDYSIEILDGDIRTLELARKNLKQTLQNRNVVLIDEKNNVPKNNYSKINNSFNDNSSSKLFAGEVVPNENCPNWGFTVKSEKDSINPLKYNFQILDDTTIPNFQRPIGYEIVEFFIYEYDVTTMSIKGSAIHTEVRPGLFFDYTFAKPGYYKYCFIITFPSNIPPCSYKVCDINPGSTKGVIEIKDKNSSEIPNCFLTGGDNIGLFYNRDKNRANARLYLRNRLFTFTIGGYTKNYRKRRNGYVRDKAGRIYKS